MPRRWPAPRSLGRLSSSLRIAKTRLPAAAQRVVLGRCTLAEFHPYQLDAAGDRVRPVVGYGDERRPLARLRLHAIDRVAERPRRTFLDRRDDLAHLGAVRVDPRFLTKPEHRLQAVGAVAGMGAKGAIVE